MRVTRHLALLCGLTACVFAGLLAYSQTAAFLWDEGFHMLAAQLILRGKRPYLDFCFPQTPLNAYWNALWMRIFGDTWREVHALAATVTTGTVLLTAEYLDSRFPAEGWRAYAATVGALLTGLNVLVIEYATIGQPYALCLFFLFAAYRVAVVAVGRTNLWWTAAVGALAGGAAASSLLGAMALPAILLWTLRYDTSLRRARKFWAFVGGAVVPFLPVVRLFVAAPRLVLFNLVEYQLFYRRANWEDATDHDWVVLGSFLSSPQALLLVALAIAGLWYVSRHSGWERACRAEFYLAAWIAAAVGAFLCTAHPTFGWYFVLTVPFLALPATAGLYALTRFLPRVRPVWVVALLEIVLSLATARELVTRHVMNWRQMEAISRKVDEVASPSQAVWAEEPIYFVTRRTPVEGTSFDYTEVIHLPADLAASLHIVHLNELDRQAAAGRFAAVETCEEQEQIDDLKLPRLFRRSAPAGPCRVFWDPVGAGGR